MYSLVSGSRYHSHYNKDYNHHYNNGLQKRVVIQDAATNFRSDARAITGQRAASRRRPLPGTLSPLPIAATHCRGCSRAAFAQYASGTGPTPYGAPLLQGMPHRPRDRFPMAAPDMLQQDADPVAFGAPVGTRRRAQDPDAAFPGTGLPAGRGGGNSPRSGPAGCIGTPRAPRGRGA